MGKKKGGGVRIKQVGPKQPQMPMMNPLEAMQQMSPDQLMLPPTPNRKYQVYWPIQESLTMKTEGFQVIYPSYLDSQKTVKQGRRVSKENAVPCPTVSDLSQALAGLQIRHVIEPHKGYSRDITCQWDNPGRVLVDVSKCPKKQLLRELPRLMEKLPSRQNRLVQEEQKRLEEEKAAEERQAAAAAALKASTTKKSTSTSNNKKKGGKKGRRK